MSEIALFGEKQDQLPAYMTQDAGLGNENVGGDTLGTPIIKLLQAMSPEVRSVEGAKVGMLYDNVANTCFEDLYASNLYFDRVFTVWKKREAGGGKEGDFASEAEAMAHINTLPYPDQYSCDETHIHYLVIFEVVDGTPKVVGPAKIYLKSSGLTPSRNWNTAFAKLEGNPPRFASVWRMSSITQTNKKGDEWANWAFDFCGYHTDENIYNELKKTYESLSGSQLAAAA